MSGYVVTVSMGEVSDAGYQWSLGHKEVDTPTVGLDMLQQAVNGAVEPVSATWDGMGKIEPFDLDIWVNEEGLLLDLPPNPAASAFASFVMGYPIILCGDCIITGMDYESGDNVPLTRDQTIHVRAMIGALAVAGGATVGGSDV